MKISLNWLNKYVAIHAETTEIAHALTMLGFEVEGVEQTGLAPMENLVVGEVLTRDKHPNADRLSVSMVRIAPDSEGKQIVCGAQNYKAGDKVLVALPDAVLPGNFKIKVSKIRGVESNGMMCSARELGLGQDHDGIMILQADAAVGTPGHEALAQRDTVFDLEITPNRPDALCHYGIARELGAWFDEPVGYPKILTHSPAIDEAPAPEILESVTVEAPIDCPLYTAHLIAGVKIGPSPTWIKARLEAIGLRSINNVVDATNFVLHELGQPLHAFDAKKISGRKLVIRHAREGEKLVTLDEKERVLAPGMLVIADAEKPLVVAGIMGGANAEVDATTTDLVLEAACFRPISTRRTSKKLGLASDSSYRFERGVDPSGVLDGARRAVDLIIELAGGTLVGPLFKCGSEPVTLKEIAITPGFVRERAGYDIPDDEIRGALEALELRIEVRADNADGGPVTWLVSIPSFRGDLDRPIDLVEEVIRIHGCERIPAADVAATALPQADDPVAEFNRAASRYLAGQHFHECVNYSMRSAAEVAQWTSADAAKTLALANPFTEEQSHLRPTLVHGLLDNLRLNQDRGTDAARLFECGRTFRDLGGKMVECISVGFVVRLGAAGAGWLKRGTADFYTAKNHLSILASVAGVDLGGLAVARVDATGSGWQAGHSAVFGGIANGFDAECGLLDLARTRALGIEGPVLAGIVSATPATLESGTSRSRYKPFSLLPSALRDLALVVDAATPSETVRREVQKAARAASAGKFDVDGVRVFDVYAGKGLPEGKKSLAFSLSYRAPDRTLTDDEVSAAFNAAQVALEAAGHSIRK
ncbi:MAG TPA: phenylalanine--tRNA ligase subunit beta [Opitutaceae bacterium]|nr:phenylalanine--tRNA ligase subunit beta [Opitutaceae bacterium]